VTQKTNERTRPPADERPSIRPLAADDLPAVAALASELGYAASVAELAERLEGIAHSPSHGLFISARADGAPLGWIHVTASRALIHEPEAEIISLVVTASARGQGIGAALVGAAEAWARSRGLDRIRVRCRLEREAAHRFYEHEGFARTKTQHVFAKDPDTR